MRTIARHPKYQQKREQLAAEYPSLLTYLDHLEKRVAENPEFPTSIYVADYDCWWSHLLVEDESIPHMRLFHAFDDDEVRFLAIVPVAIDSTLDSE